MKEKLAKEDAEIQAKLYFKFRKPLGSEVEMYRKNAYRFVTHSSTLVLILTMWFLK